MQVEKNDVVGRYAVAAKDLSAGEIIIYEAPFVYGPKPDHPPMCLGCYLPVDCRYLCSHCSWPLCGPDCEEIPEHKHAECKVFKNAGVKFQAVDDTTEICLQFECITPLRLLLAKENDPTRWESEVAQMESHDDKRKSLPIWQFNQTNIVDYLRGPCKLSHYPPELIHQVCGILEVNAFEAHPPNGGYSIRCIYPKLAVLSHNCVSNISHSISDGFHVKVRAAVELKQGDEIFASYTYAMWPTLKRRAFLMESKYFECTCRRCCDPTELGTHMGTLKCSKCDNGVILSTSPLEFDVAWNCTHCDFKTNAGAVMRVYNVVQAAVENVDEGVTDGCEAIQARETVWRKFRSALHPRHGYFSILRLSLAQMYGKINGYLLEQLPDVLLEHKVDLCMQLLANLDVVEPGFTRTRGAILYELHAPLILLARNMFKNGSIDKVKLRGRLERAIAVLREAAMILHLESEDSGEGVMGRAAQAALQQLEGNLDEMVEAKFESTNNYSK